MAEAHVLAVVVADDVVDNVLCAESERESVTVALFDLALEYEPVPVADFEGVPVVLSVAETENVTRVDRVCEDEVLIEAVIESVRVPFGEVDGEVVILRVAVPVREFNTVRDELNDDDDVNISETLVDDKDVADADGRDEVLAESDCRSDFVFIAVLEADKVTDTEPVTERDTEGDPDELDEALTENELYDDCVAPIDNVGLNDDKVDIDAVVQTVRLNRGEPDEDDDTFGDSVEENKAVVDGDGVIVRAITVTLRCALREAEDCGELLVVTETLRLTRGELDCDNDETAEREYDACIDEESFSVRVELTLIVPVEEVESDGDSVPLLLTRPLWVFEEMGDNESVALGEGVVEEELVSVK